MKNEDKTKLNPLSKTLEIKIGGVDQAQVSNQLERKEPVAPISPISKKQAIQTLEKWLKSLGSEQSVWTEAIHIAIKEIGKCHNCLGLGGVVSSDKPLQNYKVKTNPKGLKYYLVLCGLCNGSGKQLDVNCRSCGKSASVMPEQRHVDHCQECENRLVKVGNLF